MKVLAQLGDWHQLEQDMTKDSLPAIRDAFETQGRNDALERVKQTALSRINGVAHMSHNSMNDMVL